MSYGQHKGPIVPMAWDGEECVECGNNVYFTDVCVPGAASWTPAQKRKHESEQLKESAWASWAAKARAEFDKYWATYGGI